MRSLLLISMCLLLAAAQTTWAQEDAPEAEVTLADPWTLRPHYTIKLRGASLDYAEDNAELRVDAGGMRVLQNTSWSIVLGDGSSLTPANVPIATHCTREGFESDYGRGTHYTVHFPPTENNLQILHRMTTFKTQPFVLFEMTLANLGETPIEVREMNPLVIGPGGLNLGGNTIVSDMPLSARDGFAMCDPLDKPLYKFMANAEKTAGLALGILPQGRTDSGIDIQASGGAWQGSIFNHFAPALTLAPKERVSTDSIWFSYGLPDVVESNLYYSWTFSTNPHQTYEKPTPKGWITVSEDQGLSDLLAEAQAARGAGIKFALIPNGWETRPGSLQGASPRYPREPAAAARQLKDADMLAGLTIDPLGFEGGNAAWTEKSADGKEWLNLSQDGARSFVEEQVRGLLRNGFDFLVIAPSAIPDDILKKFNLTRNAADSLAIQTAATAAGGTPVFPSALASMEANDARWRSAQLDLQKLGEYKVVFGPTRLVFERGQVEAATVETLQAWPGPLELMKAPPSGVRGDLQPVFRQGQ